MDREVLDRSAGSKCLTEVPGSKCLIEAWIEVPGSKREDRSKCFDRMTEVPSKCLDRAWIEVIGSFATDRSQYLEQVFIEVLGSKYWIEVFWLEVPGSKCSDRSAWIEVFDRSAGIA
jgi:hypothetical protein